MEYPHVSAALGAFLLLLQQVLMLSVGFHRTKTKVGIGIGSDAELERKVRRHGNLAENSGIFVAVLFLMELSGLAGTAVLWFASIFAAARLSHAIGFMHQDGSHANLDGNRFFLAARVVGATLTGWTGLILGGYFGYLLFTSMST